MSRFPITNAQFAAFVKSGGYNEARYWPEAKAASVWQDGHVKAYDDKPRSQPYDFGAPFNLPNHPVVGITWYEMLAFTRWLTEVSREKKWFGEKMSMALPSEAEWEKAARGGEEILINPS
jgi:formylglycine-generating enzyme required for sulfatase activity